MGSNPHSSAGFRNEIEIRLLGIRLFKPSVLSPPLGPGWKGGQFYSGFGVGVGAGPQRAPEFPVDWFHWAMAEDFFGKKVWRREVLMDAGIVLIPDRTILRRCRVFPLPDRMILLRSRTILFAGGMKWRPRRMILFRDRMILRRYRMILFLCRTILFRSEMIPFLCRTFPQGQKPGKIDPRGAESFCAA